MLYINKNKECSSLNNYKKKHKNCLYKELHNFDDDNVRVKKEKIDTYNDIKDSLYAEQYGLCCYCCSHISKIEASIEHIVPQSVDSNLSMDYNNMLLSCNNKETCGYKKGREYNKDLFITPLESDCEANFVFNIYTGNINTNDNKNERAIYTINVLNLNSYDLTYNRCRIIKKIKERLMYNHDTKKSIYNNYVLKHKPLSDIVKFYLSNKVSQNDKRT